MNKKGFTLIELLAVMAILVIISLVAVPNIINLTKNTKDNYNLLDTIYMAAETYIYNNYNEYNTLDEVESTVLVSVTDLINNGYLKTSIINPTTGEKFTSNDYINVTRNENMTLSFEIIEYKDDIAPTVVFETNGNVDALKTVQTKVDVTDDGAISELKYLWTVRSTIGEEDFVGDKSGTFISGDTLTIPSNTAGTYYLYIYAKDSAGNVNIAKSNSFNVGNIAPVVDVTSTKIDSSVVLTLKPYSPTVLYDNGYINTDCRDFFASAFKVGAYADSKFRISAQVRMVEALDTSKTTTIGLYYIYNNSGTENKIFVSTQNIAMGSLSNWTNIGGIITVNSDYISDLSPWIQIDVTGACFTSQYQVEYQNIQYEYFDSSKISSVTVNGVQASLNNNYYTYTASTNGTYTIAVTDIYGNIQLSTYTVTNL
jgi:type IV pilus assembly protein PilA